MNIKIEKDIDGYDHYYIMIADDGYKTNPIKISSEDLLTLRNKIDKILLDEKNPLKK